MPTLSLALSLPRSSCLSATRGFPDTELRLLSLADGLPLLVLVGGLLRRFFPSRPRVADLCAVRETSALREFRILDNSRPDLSLLAFSPL